MHALSSKIDIPSASGRLPFAVDGFDSLRQPVWVFDDARKRKVYANRAALELWGAASLEALQARDFADQSPAVRIRMDAISERIARGETVHDRWTFYPHGAPVTVRTAISLIPLLDGGSGMLFEAAPAEVEAQEHRAIEALRHTTVLVALYNTEGARLFANPAAMAAYPADNASFVDSFVDREAGAQVWRTALSGRPGFGSFLLATSAGARWHSVDARRARDPVSGDCCVLVNETDITAEIEARSALGEARERAESAVRARQEFLANMSHELRTPLTSVIGFADLLAESALDERQSGQLGRIQDAGSALMATLNDVLDLSKLEAGGIELQPRPFALRPMLSQAVGIVEAQALAKRLALNMTIDEACPAWIEGDPERLRQVLVNLLGNAVKFTDEGAVGLTITRRPHTDATMARLEFAVSDTGVGVPEAMLGMVFDRFAQAGPEVTRRFGGTGLGLTITRQLVEMMGGQIGVDSTAGQGSRFWCVVDLPVASRIEASAPAVAPRVVGGLRLLVADDNEANRELIGTILRSAGHDVQVVRDGAEALAAVRSGDYDLVLMDVRMPVMDGLTATRSIRALDGDVAGIPIIALTANVLADQVAFYRDQGMDDHVGKPINPRDLLIKIAQWSTARIWRDPATA
ncbi:ATP-binding protein [Caulobacter sp. ErkDOM-YI]|uniref:ATP-binding protein n=1 Tax=unclassified Caulobacter TaxID=2648921 RepID=UPI003AF43451